VAWVLSTAKLPKCPEMSPANYVERSSAGDPLHKLDMLDCPMAHAELALWLLFFAVVILGIGIGIKGHCEATLLPRIGPPPERAAMNIT
jgi:hypothetical protein